MLLEKIQLENDEKLIKMVRKHWFVLFTELCGVAALAFIPFLMLVGLLLLPSGNSIATAFSSHYTEAIFASSLWVTLCLMGASMMWTHYYLDLWVVTDRRIIVIEQISFFNRKVSHFRLERLQDIKVRISGIIPTLLNFGSINAQTASAAESNFTSNGLPDPRGLQSLIQKAMDDRLRSLGSSSANAADVIIG